MVLGKHKKPFSAAELMKERMSEVLESSFEGIQKDELITKVNHIPGSSIRIPQEQDEWNPCG